MNLKIFIPRTHANIKTRNSIQQENIDFNTLFRYKKASTEKEEACQWDSVEALSKENPQRHSLDSKGI